MGYRFSGNTMYLAKYLAQHYGEEKEIFFAVKGEMDSLQKQNPHIHFIQYGTFAYFNDEGEVVEVSDRILDDIIPVSGIVLESAEVGQHVAIDEKQLNNMLNIIKILRKNNVAVTSGNFDEAGNFGVFSGAVYINFGNGSEIDEKVKRLNYILPKLVDMSGILHLEDWSTQDTDIVFEKTTE
jgi:cell division protein FtsQ